MKADFPDGQKLTKISFWAQRHVTSGALVDGKVYLEAYNPTTGTKLLQGLDVNISTFANVKTKYTVTVDLTLDSEDTVYIRQVGGITGQELRIFGKPALATANLHYAGSSGGAQTPDTFVPYYILGDAGSRNEQLIKKNTHHETDGWGLWYDKDGTVSGFFNGVGIHGPRTKMYADGREHVVYFEVDVAGVVKLYVDGEEIATGNSAGSTNTTQPIPVSYTHPPSPRD